MDIAKEKELIKKIQQNDSSAEDELFRLLYPRVKMIVGTRIAEWEARREIINDIIISLILKIRGGSFEGEEGPKIISYINGITRFKVRDYYRIYYGKFKLEVNYSDEISDNTEHRDNITSELEENQETELRKELWQKAIDNLKPKYKNVVFLRYYQDLTVNQISDQLKISPQKVSDYLKYSKQLLFNEISKNKNEIFS